MFAWMPRFVVVELCEPDVVPPSEMHFPRPQPLPLTMSVPPETTSLVSKPPPVITLTDWLELVVAYGAKPP